MLNEIVVEGIVTNTIWEYGGHTFFRLACYRDPARPKKSAPEYVKDHSDEPDYVTVRVVDGLVAGVPMTVEPEERIRIHGYLVSRHDRMTLSDFLRHADGDTDELEIDEEHLDISLSLNRADVIPERIVILNNGNDK